MSDNENQAQADRSNVDWETTAEMWMERAKEARVIALREAAYAVDRLAKTPGMDLNTVKAASDVIDALPGAPDRWVSIEGWPLAELKALFAGDGTFNADPDRNAPGALNLTININGATNG